MPVVRFIFHDLDGTFTDLTFTVNPTLYSPEESAPFKEDEAIDGTKSVVNFPFSKPALSMSWDRISRTFYLELRNRYRSGNRFVLKDHNYEILIGRIVEFNFEEIVATVPSCYKGSLKFVGIGKQ